MVIYIDVLLALNLFVNYFLLLCSSILMHRQTRRRRLLLGALIGSSFSFLIFLPDFGFIFTLITKLFFASGALILCSEELYFWYGSHYHRAKCFIITELHM